MDSEEDGDGGIGFHHHSVCELAYWPGRSPKNVDVDRVGYMGGFQISLEMVLLEL